MSNEEQRKKERQRAPEKKIHWKEVNNKEKANYKGAEKGGTWSKLIFIWVFSNTKSQKNLTLFINRRLILASVSPRSTSLF